MDQYTFGSFFVDEANREAYDLCMRVAEFSVDAAKPIVLVAESGGGKTHLLYSVLNRVRAATPAAGVACATARDFPADIRRLADDSAPLDRIDKAIFLVDDVDKFKGGAEKLEAVVRAFLARGHTVLLTSAEHPKRIHRLSDQFRAMLEDGRIAYVLPQDARRKVQLIEQRVRDECEAIIHGQREEIERLKNRVPTPEDQAVPAGAPRAGEVDAELEALREELQRKELEASELNDELESLRAENALLNAAKKEAESLRRRVRKLEDRNERLQAEAESLKDHIADTATAQANAASSGEADGGQAGHYLRKLQSLLSEIRGEHDALAGERRAYDTKLDRLTELEKVFTTDSTSDSDARTQRAEIEGSGHALQARLDELEAERARLAAECDTLKKTVAQALPGPDDLEGEGVDEDTRSDALDAEAQLAALRGPLSSALTQNRELVARLEESDGDTAESSDDAAPDTDTADTMRESVSEESVPVDTATSAASETGTEEVGETPETESEESPSKVHIFPGESALHHVEQLRRSLDILAQDDSEDAGDWIHRSRGQDKTA